MLNRITNAGCKIYLVYLQSMNFYFRGLCTIFNVPGNYYDFSRSSSEGDAQALRSDWEIAMKDLARVLDASPIECGGRLAATMTYE
jgi:hypothetical protein